MPHPAKLQLGDLVLFTTACSRCRVSHVGIDLGDDKFVHAPRREINVQASDLGKIYWSKHYQGARAYIYIEKPRLNTLTLAVQNSG